jgi:hypothetical protein
MYLQKWENIRKEEFYTDSFQMTVINSHVVESTAEY